MRLLTFGLSLWLLLSGVSEACQLYRDVMRDSSGKVIAGVSISVKYAGTSTLPTIYSEKTCTTSTGNPLLSDSSGTFSFWVQDGVYDLGFVLTGYTFSTITNIPVVSGGMSVISVKTYNAKGDGTTDDTAAIQAALTAVAMTGGTLYFPAGTYTYATSPNFGRVGVDIYADAAAVFKHTGTGNAFVIDGSSELNGLSNRTYTNLTIQGNSNSTNGLYVKKVGRSRFVHPWIKGSSTTGSGIRLVFCIANEWDTPVISSNTTLNPRPLYGISMTRDGVNEHTTTQTIINGVFEGITTARGAGIYLDYAELNTFLGGTSEGNVNGVIITGDSGTGRNRFNGTWFEANSTADIELQASAVMQQFENVIATGTTTIAASTARNTFHGGYFGTVKIDVNAGISDWFGSLIGVSLTDNSIYGNFVNAIGPGGVPIRTRFRGGVSAGRVNTTYGASVAINAGLGNWQVITATNGTAFTVANPTNGMDGQRLTITIRNTSGGALGVASFDTAYKKVTAWTQPAKGFSRSIDFVCDGTNWIEVGRTAADVPN